MNAEQEFMRAMVGDQNFCDLTSICAKLTALEERGAISAAWHSHMLEEIAGELVTRQIANEMTEEALTAPPPCPDASDSCGH